MNEFDNFNGYLTEKGEKIFIPGNRSFKYGDGLFETMKIVDGAILYWEYHYKRLKLGIDTLKLDDTNFPKEFWEKELEKVINKNYYKFARLRLTVYRDSPGLYTPLGNRIGFIVEGTRYDKPDFSYVPEGINLGVFKEHQKVVGTLSNCKTTSAILFVLASIYKKDNNLDDVLILNSLGNVCEASASNVFIANKGEIITPPLSEGCISGVMREQVIEFSKHIDKIVIEKALTLKDLEEAEEIFLTNVISGIQHVKTFNGKAKKSTHTIALQNFLK